MGSSPNTPQNSEILTQYSAIRFNTTSLAPPADAYIRPDDQLVIDLTHNNPNVPVLVRARLLRVDGVVMIIEEQMFSTSTGSTQRYILPLAEGFLLSIAVSTPATFGNTLPPYVAVYLSQNIAATYNVTACFISDYVTFRRPASWTPGVSAQGVPQPIWKYSTILNPPAAGQDWTWSIPQYQRHKLLGICARFQTSAVVASRQVTLVINVGGVPIYQYLTAAAQPASTLALYTFSNSNTLASVNGTQFVTSIPTDLELAYIDSVQVVTANKDAADQWSNISILSLAGWDIVS